MSGRRSASRDKSMEETKQYHARYLRAINSPVRRKILRALKGGCETLEVLEVAVGVEKKALQWHLSVLEHGCCVIKEVKEGKLVYTITREGMVVNHIE